MKDQTGLCNSYDQLITIHLQRGKQLPEGPQNFCRDCSQMRGPPETEGGYWWVSALRLRRITGREVLEGLLQPLTEMSWQ